MAVLFYPTGTVAGAHYTFLKKIKSKGPRRQIFIRSQFSQRSTRPMVNGTRRSLYNQMRYFDAQFFRPGPDTPDRAPVDAVFETPEQQILKAQYDETVLRTATTGHMAPRVCNAPLAFKPPLRRGLFAPLNAEPAEKIM